METSLSLFPHATMPLSYWPYAFQMVVYHINRLSTPTPQLVSPYVELFGQPSNYGKLRSFWCLFYPWLRPYTPHKLALPSPTPHHVFSLDTLQLKVLICILNPYLVISTHHNILTLLSPYFLLSLSILPLSVHPLKLCLISVHRCLFSCHSHSNHSNNY